MLQPFNDHPVTVLAQNGTPVTFFSQDMKALLTMLWANGSPTSRFVGNRCKIANPARNANGRIIEPTCFDPNPATWHIAIANQFGINKRTFVIDATYDQQVWNHPLVSAKSRFFNPATFEDMNSLESATIPISTYRTDRFREFRSPSATKIVGVYMDLTYVIEIEPGHSRVFDTPTKTIRLIYDLELDDSYNILGGEWYSNAHPDFMWTFERGAQALAFEDAIPMQDPWSNNTPVPLSWSQYAGKASARGEPLYAFIKKVVDAAGNSVYVGPH